MSASKKHQLLLFLFFLVSLVLLVSLTSPTSGPVIIVSFISLVFLVSYQAMVLVFAYFEHIRIGSVIITKTGRRYTCLAIAIGVTYVLGLSTVGQLQPIDILLVALLEAGVIFYVIRRL